MNEQVWLHNQYTVEGIHAHQRADRSRESKTGDERTAYALWIVSHRLGLIGKADAVEFRVSENRADTAQDDAPRLRQEMPCNSERLPRGTELIRGLVPYPVEFTRGRRRWWDNGALSASVYELFPGSGYRWL